MAVFLVGMNGFGWAASVTRVQYLMGTVCEIKASGPNEQIVNKAITAAFAEISRLEAVLSTYQPSSEVSNLNKSKPNQSFACSSDLYSLLKESRLYSEKTNGAFDVTLKNDGYQHVELSDLNSTVVFNALDMRVDFGGIGKGFALDKAATVLKQNHVNSAELNFSGNILVFGNGKNPVEIQLADPYDAAKSVLTLAVINRSVSTSSQLEKKDHIIDTRSNKPAPFQGSVTVLSPTATEADALSTALLVLGPEKGIRLLGTNFKESAAVYLVPSPRGWTQVASKNFQKY